MSTTTKTPSSFKRTLRTLELGLALGLAAFLVGTMLQSRLTLVLLGQPDQSGLVSVLFAQVIRNSLIPTLVVAPLIAYAVGLYLEGQRWLLGWSIAIGTQLFPPAIDGVSNGWSTLIAPAFIVVFLVTTILSGLLCSVAVGRGQRRATARAAAPVVQVEAGALSKIDFEAVKKAAEAQPDPAPAEAAAAAAPVESVPAESAPKDEPKTGT